MEKHSGSFARLSVRVRSCAKTAQKSEACHCGHGRTKQLWYASTRSCTPASNERTFHHCGACALGSVHLSRNDDLTKKEPFERHVSTNSKCLQLSTCLGAAALVASGLGRYHVCGTAELAHIRGPRRLHRRCRVVCSSPYGGLRGFPCFSGAVAMCRCGMRCAGR